MFSTLRKLIGHPRAPYACRIVRDGVAVGGALLLLAGCSSLFEPTVSAPPAPTLQDWAEPPSASTVASGITIVATEAHLVKPLEVSEIHTSRPSSLEPWTICLRSGADAKSRQMVYSVFFMNDKYSRSALAAIVDECPTQVFTPVKE